MNTALETANLSKASVQQKAKAASCDVLLFLWDEWSLLLSFGKAAWEQASWEELLTNTVFVKVFGVSLFAELWGCPKDRHVLVRNGIAWVTPGNRDEHWWGEGSDVLQHLVCLTCGSGPGDRISHLYEMQWTEKQKDLKRCFKKFHLKTLANADALGHWADSVRMGKQHREKGRKLKAVRTDRLIVFM